MGQPPQYSISKRLSKSFFQTRINLSARILTFSERNALVPTNLAPFEYEWDLDSILSQILRGSPLRITLNTRPTPVVLAGWPTFAFPLNGLAHSCAVFARVGVPTACSNIRNRCKIRTEHVEANPNLTSLFWQERKGAPPSAAWLIRS